MPIGKYTSTSPKPAELEAPTNAAVETPKPPEEPVVAKKATGPITPRQAVVGAVTEDLDRKVAEGAGLEQRQRTYAEVLAAEGIPLQEAERIVEALLIDGFYEETYMMTRRTSVTFRSRDYADTQRYLQAIEAYKPTYQSERNEIITRYVLASSLSRFGGETFEFADPGDIAAAQAAFDKRHAFLMKKPEVVVRWLMVALAKFDRKLDICAREGAVENF